MVVIGRAVENSGFSLPVKPTIAAKKQPEPVAAVMISGTVPAYRPAQRAAKLGPSISTSAVRKGSIHFSCRNIDRNGNVAGSFARSYSATTSIGFSGSCTHSCREAV